MAPIDHKAFERAVRDLLALSGVTTGELQLSHKKVDLLLEGHRLGRRWRTAVECKAHGKRLTLSQTGRIVNDYRPLIEQRHVEEVLLVTQEGLSPSSETLLYGEPAFAHLTYTELSNEILDLSGYNRDLIASYSDSPTGISHYYIRARTADGTDLQGFLEDWVVGGDGPIAILGAYGTGKSTFATHFASCLATRALADPTERRPVLIRLSDISAEQTLEGLLGRSLGVTSAIPNYSFPRFMALNRAGRFVVILDGFDEMKRTLTWEEFRYNFGQLNRLIDGQSRVVLLGRPTAFLNDAEFSLALHGIDHFGGREVRLAEWPDYTTIELAPFTAQDISRFLRGYLQWTMTQRDAPTPRKPSKERRRGRSFERELEHQLARIEGAQLKDIARRPVQLRMLAEILPTYSGPLDRLDTTILFDQFIDRIIVRDASKLTRTRFDAHTRRQFAVELAWWLWTESTAVRIAPEEIPDDMIRRFAGPKDNLQAVRRDLVAACFLDRQHGGPLVFPHRSFQEFLVAERASELIRQEAITVRRLDQIVNPEIAGFMYGIVGAAQMGGFEKALVEHTGELSVHVARIWYSDLSKLARLESQWRARPMSLWHTQLVTLGCIHHGKDARGIISRAAEILIRGIGATWDENYALLLWRCALALSTVHAHPDTVAEEATRALAGFGVHVQSKARKSGDVRLRNRTRGSTAEYVRPSPSVARILKHISFSARGTRMDPRGSYGVLEQRLRPVCWVRGAHASDDLPTGAVEIEAGGLQALVRDYVAGARV